MPLVVVPFAVVVIAFVLLAMALTAKVWADALARGIEGARRGGIAGILTMPARILGRVIHPAVNYVAHEVSKAASHYMRPLALYLNGLAAWGLANVVAVGLFAERVAVGFERLTTVVIPREIGRVTRPLERRLTHAAKVALGAALGLAALRKWAHHLWTHEIHPALHWLRHEVAVELPRDIAGVGARVKDLERSLANPSKRWLRRIAAAMWAATMLGLMLKVLARRFPWLFCRKVKAVGNRTCGLDPDLLNAILLDTVLIGGTISIVEFARELQGIERGVAGIIRGFIRDA